MLGKCDGDDKGPRCRRDEGDFAEGEGECLEEFLGVLGFRKEE